MEAIFAAPAAPGRWRLVNRHVGADGTVSLFHDRNR
jgi:hypothetical protein